MTVTVKVRVTLKLRVESKVPLDLSHPLVFDLGDLGVCVAHHGDQQVQQQDHHDRDEDEEVNLA